MKHANVLVMTYQYMLDPKVSKLVSKDIGPESTIVFDEAHNIDSVCIEALSVTIHDRGLEQATRSLARLSSEIVSSSLSRSRNNNNNITDPTDLQQRFQEEYQSLVDHPIDEGLFGPSVS